MSFNGTLGGRPPSGMGRPGSSAMVPPGTSSRAGGPPAGAMGAVPNVNARPVQNQGMKATPTAGGVRQGTAGGGAGGGRLTQDRTYWISILRPKTTELMGEIDRLREQEESISKGSGTLVAMQQKQKSLVEEIAKLKASMADINLAVEHSSTGEAEQISGQAQNLRLANAEMRKNVDKLFLQVKDVEGQIQNQQAQLDTEMGALDERLRNDPRTYQEYRSAREQMYAVSDDLLKKQQEVRNETRRQDTLLQSLSQDVDKKRAAPLILDIIKKRQQREELNRECSISIEEERDQLVKQAKAAAQDTDVLQRKITEVKDSLSEIRNRIVATNEDLNEYSGDNMRKYQELQEKDREMTEFMDSFKEREREELERIRQIEALIQGMLEHISRAEQVKATLPQDGAPLVVDGMGNELNEKEKQLETAKVTYQRLQRQLEEKKEELDKVQDLDSRIQHDIQTMQARMEEQQREIGRFSDLDTLRRDIDNRKKSLGALRTVLIKQRDASKQQLHVLSQKYETARQKLNENDLHSALNGQETKLRLVWQSVFALDELVRTKEKEANYKSTKAECIRTTDDINTMLKDPKRGTTDGSTGGVATGSVGFQWQA